MNVYKKQVHLLERTTHTEQAYTVSPSRDDQRIRNGQHLHIRASLLTHTDGKARLKLLEALKTRVDAGQYCVESTRIAQKLLATYYLH